MTEFTTIALVSLGAFLFVLCTIAGGSFTLENTRIGKTCFAISTTISVCAPFALIAAIYILGSQS